ncbi:MAG: RdgB/HAM1 family non-canonical purine NTP pyrophosphatase [Oscillospiraceae bacterium]|jgi:XTP/dITP diphosphohydrolase
MKQEFILASNNQKKLVEMREILSQMGYTVISQREAGCHFEVEETGTTFAENAYLKASAVTAFTGKPAIADDSGLVVDALDGAPGIYSARYGGDTCRSDVERYALLLRNMEGKENRAARFVSSIACTFPNGDVVRAEGVCQGAIRTAPAGDGGFGYDPIFQPEGMEISMAELTNEEKHAISHRGNAIREFQERLTEYYADK